MRNDEKLDIVTEVTTVNVDFNNFYIQNASMISLFSSGYGENVGR